MRTMTFLLDHTSAPITEAVVVGALMSGILKMVQSLLDRAIDLPVTRKMVHAAAQHSRAKCLALIWERACRAEVTEDIFKDLAQAAAEIVVWPRKNLRFLLDVVEDIVNWS